MSCIRRRLPIWREFPIDLISRSPIARWAPVPLRLIVGYGFMEHGFAKLARGLDAFPAILQAIGVPAPHFMGWFTIFVEIFGGLAVFSGAGQVLTPAPIRRDGGDGAQNAVNMLAGAVPEIDGFVMPGLRGLSYAGSART